MFCGPNCTEQNELSPLLTKCVYNEITFLSRGLRWNQRLLYTCLCTSVGSASCPSNLQALQSPLFLGVMYVFFFFAPSGNLQRVKHVDFCASTLCATTVDLKSLGHSADITVYVKTVRSLISSRYLRFALLYSFTFRSKIRVSF